MPPYPGQRSQLERHGNVTDAKPCTARNSICGGSRSVGHAVAHPSSLIPEPRRVLYELNPMVTVMVAVEEGFRWALLSGACPPPSAVILVSAAAVDVLFGQNHYTGVHELAEEVVKTPARSVVSLFGHAAAPSPRPAQPDHDQSL